MLLSANDPNGLNSLNSIHLSPLFQDCLMIKGSESSTKFDIRRS